MLEYIRLGTTLLSQKSIGLLAVTAPVAFLVMLILFISDSDRARAEIEQLNWIPIDTFELYTLNASLDGQNNWVADGAQVELDPEDTNNQVMGFTNGLERWFAFASIPSISNTSTGTFFFRVYRQGNANTFVGLSDVSTPDFFPDFETQFGARPFPDEGPNPTNNFVIRNGGNFEFVDGFTANRWHCVWMVANNNSDTFTLFTQEKNGSGPNQITLSGGQSTFNFRNGGTNPLSTLFVLYGPEGSQEIVMDDFYIDTTGQNLTDPSGNCVDTPAQTHSISNVVFEPASPANLDGSQFVNLTFDYFTTEASGVRIWAVPIQGDGSTSGEIRHGSPLYSTGSGSGSGYFTINCDGVSTVDQVRFQMWDDGQTRLLNEIFVDVDYTLTAPISTPVPPPSGQNLTTNGNFDLANDNSWVSFSSQNFALIDAFQLCFSANSSPNYAWLGGTSNLTDRIIQNISIPSGGNTTLNYFYRIRSNDNCGSDTATLRVNGTVLQQYDLCLNTITDQWQYASVDLSSYAGQTVAIAFELVNGPSFASSFFVDSVSANYVTLTPTPTFTPTPSNPPVDPIVEFEFVYAPFFPFDPTPTPTPFIDPCDMFEAEPNNSREEADQRDILPNCINLLLQGDFSASESESNGNYYDIFAYEHPQTGPLALSLSNMPFASNYNLLIVDNLNAEVASSNAPGTDSEIISIPTLAAGKYYISVENIGAISSGQLYRLELSR